MTSATLAVKQSGLTHNINEMKRAFSLLASMVANKGVRVVFQGTTAATDHKTIYLPQLSLLEKKNMSEEDVTAAQDFLNAVRGFLFHEVAHILFTDEDLMHRALQGGGMLLKQAVNVVEDVRIEQEMAKKWRGAGVSLELMNEWMLKKQLPLVEKAPFVARVIVGIGLVARVGRDHWFFKALEPATQELFKLFAPEIRAARQLEDSNAAFKLGERIIEKLKKMLDEEPSEDEEEMLSLSAGESRSTKKGQRASASAQDQEEDSSGEEEAREEEVDEELVKRALEEARQEAEKTDDELAAALEQATNKAGHISGFVTTAGSSGKYIPYTTQFDTIEVVRGGDDTRYQAMMVEAKAHFGILKRNLANLLRARANTLTITELEEGDLDSGMLYRLASGLSQNVFKEDFEHFDADVGVVLLVNESGSMIEPVAGAGNYVRRIDLAKITAALMGEVLESIGVKFAVYGHSTGNDATDVYQKASPADHKTFSRWGSNAFYVYKSFEESFSSAKSRVVNMAPRNNTHDAEALVFAGNKLLDLKVGRRLLMTLDDGEPYPNTPNTKVPVYDPATHQYRPVVAPDFEAEAHIRSMPRLHEAYLKDVVTQLAASGVEILGMGMGTTSVENYYPKSVVVRDVASFPVVALKELRKLLLTVPRK